MRMPEGWDGAPVKQGSKKAMTAKLNMTEEVAGTEHCPECGNPMVRVVVNGQPAVCCFQDRIVLPVKNEKLQAEQPA